MKPTKLVMSIIYSVILFVLISLLFLNYDILWAVFCVIFILILTIGVHRIKTLKEESERYKNQSDVWKERYKEALKKKSKFGTSKALEAKVEYRGDNYSGTLIQDQPDVPHIHVSDFYIGQKVKCIGDGKWIKEAGILWGGEEVVCRVNDFAIRLKDKPYWHPKTDFIPIKKEATNE